MASRRLLIRLLDLVHSVLIVAALMALAGCDEPPLGEPGTLGHVAYSAAGTGKVKIVDVTTGAARTVSQGDGPYGTVNLSLDGSGVAYTYHYPEQLKRDVFVADVDSGEVRAITPGTGQYLPALFWLRSGWLWYPYTQRSLFLRALVGPQMTEARTVGGESISGLVESPVDSRIAYVDGAAPNLSLIVEEPDGSSRRMYSVNPTSRDTIFTPDGRSLVFTREADDAHHLLLVSLETESLFDVGPVNSDSFSTGIEGTSIFSPDGAEILVRRDQQLVAVKLDASSERVITSDSAGAGFTSKGDIVYVEMINTEDPPDDTPEFVYSVFVVNREGDVVALFERSPDCGVARVSNSGAFIGVTCGYARTQIFRPDGTLTFESDAGGLVDFDHLETGVVLHSGDLVYATLDGSKTRMLAQLYGLRANVEGPLFDYAP